MEAAVIYFIQAGADGPIKIGYTKERIQGRLNNMQVGNPAKMRLLGTAAGDKEDEKALHGKFHKHRIRGEWFDPAPEIRALIRSGLVALAPLVEDSSYLGDPEDPEGGALARVAWQQYRPALDFDYLGNILAGNIRRWAFVPKSRLYNFCHLTGIPADVIRPDLADPRSRL